MTEIRVFIADDHTLFRQGIAGILRENGSFRITGQSDSIEKLMASNELSNSDVLTLDISFGEESSFSVLQKIVKRNPNLNVLILSMHNKPMLIKRSFNSGASGYFIKSSPAAQLIEAIKTINDGHKYIDPALSDNIFTLINDTVKDDDSDSLYNLLSNREQEIFRLLAEGEKPVSIARQLNISRKTAENHRSNIIQKLKLGSPVEIAQLAKKLGVV